MVFKRRLKPVATVDLIPMIDVIFQLVVFFMVSSTFLVTPGIALELPDSTSAEPVVLTSLIITIISEDEIYLNEDPTTVSGLGDLLVSLAGNGDSVKSVIIEGDRRVSYNTMIEILDVLRLNGFTGINLRMRDSSN